MTVKHSNDLRHARLLVGTAHILGDQVKMAIVNDVRIADEGLLYLDDLTPRDSRQELVRAQARLDATKAALTICISQFDLVPRRASLTSVEDMSAAVEDAECRLNDLASAVAEAAARYDAHLRILSLVPEELKIARVAVEAARAAVVTLNSLIEDEHEKLNEAAGCFAAPEPSGEQAEADFKVHEKRCAILYHQAAEVAMKAVARADTLVGLLTVPKGDHAIMIYRWVSEMKLATSTLFDEINPAKRAYRAVQGAAYDLDHLLKQLETEADNIYSLVDRYRVAEMQAKVALKFLGTRVDVDMGDLGSRTHWLTMIAVHRVKCDIRMLREVVASTMEAAEENGWDTSGFPLGFDPTIRICKEGLLRATMLVDQLGFVATGHPEVDAIKHTLSEQRVALDCILLDVANYMEIRSSGLAAELEKAFASVNKDDAVPVEDFEEMLANHPVFGR